jgi:YidC/Oxa1 family membrane protein insertase
MAIVLMTVTIRLAILPLTFKGVKGMQELQRLQPEMKKLQERYKDDRQRLQQETMRFYKEHQVNPLSSCLPLLLQIPFFIALFYLLQDNVDIEGASFLFIPDLAAEGAAGLGLGVLIALIVIYVATQLGASLVSMVSADKTQRRIFLALPFVFVVFIISFPAGLIVYWITTNVWTVGQQLLVRKLYPKPEPLTLAPEGRTPARGKPIAPAGADGASGDGGSRDAADAGNGRPAKAPPRSPRKRKKRTGRRR